MSVHYQRNRDRWIVRWREDGRQRSRTVANEAEAQALDPELNPDKCFELVSVGPNRVHGCDQVGFPARALDPLDLARHELPQADARRRRATQLAKPTPLFAAEPDVYRGSLRVGCGPRERAIERVCVEDVA